MKNLVKFSLTLLSAGVLAACSSSSSDNNSPKADTQTTPSKSNTSTQTAPTTKSSTGTQTAAANNLNTSTQTAPTTKSNTGTQTATANNSNSSVQTVSANKSSNTGTQTVPTGSSNNTASTKNSADDDDDMGDAFRIKDKEDFDLKKTNISTWKTELVVDGKKLPISPSGVLSQGFTKVSNTTINGVYYEQLAVSGLKYSDVKFGVANGYVFAQGNVTPDSEIPTTGKATYSVDGVLVQNGVVKTSEGNILTADFANKTINGSVFNGWTVTNAKIDGNDFSGKVVCPKGFSAELDGHFYGKNASEIGGAYSSAGFSGAFGGKKQ